MPQDIQQINWAPYFTSGENFGQAFNQDFNAAQRLKFEQARALVDDEMARQRLAQQQQSTNQLGDYYKALTAQGAQRNQISQGELDLAREKQKEAADKSLTPEDYQKMFLGYAGSGPSQGQMPVSAAIAAMKATPGVDLTPQQEQAFLSGVAKIPGQNIGMQPTPVDIVQHPAGMVSPPPGQDFLPGTQEALARKQALTQQSQALASLRAWQMRNGDKITTIKQDAAVAHIKSELLDDQIKQNKLDMAKKWGDKLNQLKIDMGDVRTINAATYRWATAIKANDSTTANYKQAKDDARFTFDLIKSQQSDLDKQYNAKSLELDKNDLHKNVVWQEENALIEAGASDPNNPHYGEYLEKQAQHTAAMNTSVQLKSQLEVLKKQQTDLLKASQGVLNIFKQQAAPNGQSVPLPNSNLKSLKSGGLPSVGGFGATSYLDARTPAQKATVPGKVLQMKDGTRWQKDASGKWIKL